MKAERAKNVVMLARAFGCSVTEVKAMSVREVHEMTDAIEAEQRAMKRARARAKARGR